MKKIIEYVNTGRLKDIVVMVIIVNLHMELHLKKIFCVNMETNANIKKDVNFNM